MSELVMLFLAGTGGAALIKLLDNVIQFSLQRRAKRKDNGQKEKTEAATDDFLSEVVIP